MTRQRWSKPDRIPNEPLRLAVIASDMTLSDICRRLGWVRSDASSRGAETSRLKRSLGMDGTQSKDRHTGEYVMTYTSTVDIERARDICRALEVDFDELYPELPPQRTAQKCSTCGERMLRRDPSGMCGWCIEEVELFGQVQVAA